MNEFIHSIPKAELHLHIEGTLEPEMMFALAKRNGIQFRYNTVEDIRTTMIYTHVLQRGGNPFSIPPVPITHIHPASMPPVSFVVKFTCHGLQDPQRS